MNQLNSYNIIIIFFCSYLVCVCVCVIVGCSIISTVYYTCPVVEPNENPEDCVTTCESHSDCSSPLYCCYDGCGYSCSQPSRIPYIRLESYSNEDACPSPSEVPCADMADGLGSCLNDDYSCDEGSICCENACSSALCLSTADSTPCFTAVKMAISSNSSTGLLGTYEPRCTTQGLFRAIQCYENYCWCVDTKTGEPLSDIVPFQLAHVLECTGET